MNNFSAACLILLGLACIVAFTITCIIDFNEEVDSDKDYLKMLCLFEFKS